MFLKCPPNAQGKFLEFFTNKVCILVDVLIVNVT